MPPWTKEGLTREQYGRKYLALAFNVEFDENDKEYQGDIRYDDLQRQNDSVLASERWRSQEAPSEPPHIRELVNGETYKLVQLPLGSAFRMPDGTEHKLDRYTYMPRPSKGSSIEISNQISELDNSLIARHGAVTELGRTLVTFLSHPNKKHFAKPSKSAAKKYKSVSPRRSQSPKAAVKTPSKSSLYKKKTAIRMARVLSEKRTTRRKRGSRAKSVSVDKVKISKSPTRRRKSK